MPNQVNLISPIFHVHGCTIMSNEQPLEHGVAIITPKNEKGLSLVRVSQGCKSQTSQEWVHQAASLLTGQWPSGGSVEDYTAKVLYPGQDSTNLDRYALPCSYIFLQNDTCVGHGRLNDCFESAGGNAAAATFIIIDSNLRGQRLGSAMMSLLEEETQRLGYHYLYLWTHTAIPFYESLGYKRCVRVSLQRDCLKSLSGAQVESLEGLLFQRKQKMQQLSQPTTPDVSNTPAISSSIPAATGDTRAETIMLPPEDDSHNAGTDVWLRKRLVEQVGSQLFPMDQRLEEISEFLADAYHGGPSLHGYPTWKYFLASVAWQGQIGPSCGLAALRMVREYFQTSHDDSTQLPSLLGEAQERGYTMDGELFDISHLLDLAQGVCGLDCEVISDQGSKGTLETLVGVLRRGGVAILPYDSAPGTKLPVCLSGQRAHYGIIVGILVGSEGPSSSSPSTSSSRETPEDQEFRIEAMSKEDDWGALLHESTSEVYLLVQHGLSSRICIARYETFRSSNLQLTTVDEVRFGEQSGLNLCGRTLLCHGLDKGYHG
eukprot:Nitzschia sp. Nitz4//scaffold77_size91520//47120//48853//NITZ4_004892-RA/size91520-augustus-gene-0.61-mRNA-1//1//CDS//3329557997//7309//frame0